MLRRLVKQLFGHAPETLSQATPPATLQQALTLMQRRDYAGAAQLCESIISRDPGAAQPLEMLGAIALEIGDTELACQRFEAALRLGGESLQALCNAAEANRQYGRFSRALELTARALELDPDNGAAMHVRALALQSCWRMEEAFALCRRTVERHPELARQYATYLFMLALTGADARTVRDAHVRWAGIQAEPLGSGVPAHANSRDPHRRLRVGYVSADFRDHAASRFIEPILANHDASGFEVFCYSSVENLDSTSARLRGLVAGWRDIRWQDDVAVAELVRADAIDILVDLSGHTGGNRLGVFARKPAPLQVTYLGYPSTTGMSAMDWRLTDAIADPPGLAEPGYTERLLRLPNSMWCFQPGVAMPDPGPPPSASHGYITFGSPNSLFKLTQHIVSVWSRLLQSVPGSRLLLATIAQGEARERIAAEFARHGVPAQALVMHPQLGQEDFWKLYAQIDIALDSWPCNGGATTCETLWAGVPVVTLAGDLFQSRAGYSLLSAAGLPELVAHSDDEYIAIARNLAGDPERLLRMRREMRQRMRASPLLDAAQFTRDLEGLYRRIWTERCGA